MGNRSSSELPSQGGSAVLAAVLVCLALFGICAKLKVLCALNWLHALGLALCALKLQHDLLGGLSLLVKHWLCLPSEARLLLIVTALPLGHDRSLSSLVLGDFVRPMLLAPAAVRVPGLGNVHHCWRHTGRESSSENCVNKPKAYGA